jgi:hypothetical protein
MMENDDDDDDDDEESRRQTGSEVCHNYIYRSIGT